MRKLSIFLLAAALLAGIATATAQSVTVNGISYSYSTLTKEAVVIPARHTPYSGDIVIPDSAIIRLNFNTFVRMPVVGIADSAFYNTPITRVDIGRNVKSIGSLAFARCTSLRRIVARPMRFPSLHKVSSNYFNSFDQVDTSIPVFTYRGSEYFQALLPGHALLYNGWMDFENRHFIPVVGDTINTHPLRYRITSQSPRRAAVVSHPSYSTELGTLAVVSSEVTDEMGDTYRVTAVGRWAFGGYASQVNIVRLPATIDSIADYAFFECDLTSFTVPDSVRYIGYRALAGCDQLKSLNIPVADPEFVGEGFLERTNVGSYDLRGPKTHYRIIDGMFFKLGADKTLIHLFNTASMQYGHFRVPTDVRRIGDFACAQNRRFSTLSLPASVGEIGEFAFWGCNRLSLIFCEGSVPPLTSLDAFAEVRPTPGGLKSVTAQVPTPALTTYMANEVWRRFSLVDQSNYWTDMADFMWYSDTQTSFTLHTAAQLAGLARLVNDGVTDFRGDTILLAADINLSGHRWVPIGNEYYTRHFSGLLDGRGHTVSGINGLETQPVYSGLFGVIYDGTVRHLHIGSDNNFNAPAAIEVGGLAACVSGAVIDHCSNAADISGHSDTGGLVGEDSYGSLLVNCWNTGRIEGVSGVGGLIGYNFGTRIQNCYNRGQVKATERSAGGLGSHIEESVRIINNYNRALVTAPEEVGALFGWIDYGEDSVSADNFYLKSDCPLGLSTLGTMQTNEWFLSPSKMGLLSVLNGNVLTHNSTRPDEVPWMEWVVDPDLNDGYPTFRPDDPNPSTGLVEHSTLRPPFRTTADGISLNRAARVTLHAADGRLLFSGHTDRLTLPASGLYLLRLDGRTWKVARF